MEISTLISTTVVIFTLFIAGFICLAVLSKENRILRALAVLVAVLSFFVGAAFVIGLKLHTPPDKTKNEAPKPPLRTPDGQFIPTQHPGGRPEPGMRT